MKIDCNKIGIPGMIEHASGKGNAVVTTDSIADSAHNNAPLTESLAQITTSLILRANGVKKAVKADNGIIIKTHMMPGECIFVHSTNEAVVSVNDEETEIEANGTATFCHATKFAITAEYTVISKSDTTLTVFVTRN